MERQTMERTFKLFDFNIVAGKCEEGSDEEGRVPKENTTFIIQMFGINEKGETCSITVEEYKPFFYVKVDETWTKNHKVSFLNHIKGKMGSFYENSIVECKLIERKKLYGFDGGKLHKFVMFKFSSMNAFNRAKNIWYKNNVTESGENERVLHQNGYVYKETNTELYESNIPPLLRFFHIREISPSGWVALPNNKTTQITGCNKTTTCSMEFVIHYQNIIPLNEKETMVPYKIMSFDIEASSSHGDFPVPIKSYKKLATNIVDYFNNFNNKQNMTREVCASILTNIIKCAFGFMEMKNIDKVYPKTHVTDLEELNEMIKKWFQTKVRDYSNKNGEEHSIEILFEMMHKEFHSKNEEKTSVENENDESDDEDVER